jgi:hypothetical protein
MELANMVQTSTAAAVPVARTDHAMVAPAQRLLAEYVRRWGLRDPSTIAQHCQRWTRQALRATSDRRPKSTNELCIAAMNAAMRDVDAWLDMLTDRIAGGLPPAESPRGALAIELQRLLPEHHELFLNVELVVEMLAKHPPATQRPVVPVSRPTHMESQPLGELPPAMRPEWWRRLGSRLTTSVSSVMRQALGLSS